MKTDAGRAGVRSLQPRRGSCQGRIALLLVMALVMFLALAGTVLAADRWTDISDQTWVAAYQTTAEKIDTVADGYPDNTFKPDRLITRQQFAKMAVDGLGLTPLTPSTARFLDVPTTHPYYKWIEGAVAKNIIGGFTDNTFRGSQYITRQQANSILGLYLSQEERDDTGYIQGDKGQYESLAAWYLAEGSALPTPFVDGDEVSMVHRQATAYLIYHGVVKGSQVGAAKYLRPFSNLTRAQAAVMIVRVKETAFPEPAELHLSVADIPNPVVAGTSSNVTVTARDQYGNLASDYRGTIRFTSTDGKASLPGNYTFTGTDAGAHTFASGVILRTLGSQTVSVVDTATGSITGSQTVQVVTSSSQPSTLRFTVSGLTDPVTAGQASTVIVTVRDASNKVVTGYTGTVHFTSSDPHAVLPANYTFTVADAGTHTFTNGVTLKTAGSQTVTATDTIASITGSQTLKVNPAASSKMVIETLANGSGAAVEAVSVKAGSKVTVYAISRDVYNNYVDNTAAAWSLTGKTAGVVDGDLVPAPNGKSAVFTGHLMGTAVIQAVTTVGAFTDDTGIITVTAGDVTKVRIEDEADGSGTEVGSESITMGSSLTLYAISRDSQNNFIANTAATWSFASRTGGVVNGDLVAATDRKSAVFTGHALGSGVIRIQSGALSDTTGTIDVVPGYRFVVVGINDPVAAGALSSVTVTILNETDAIATDYTGTVRFTSNDPQAVLPANYTFTSGDAGTHTFTDGVTLKTAGSRTVTVTDTVTSTIKGSQTVTVNAGPAARIVLETKADGTGTAVGARTLTAGNPSTGTLTVYA
ncbi:MAG: S-layer homology domain-containing protein, partial [Actinobacteria bacterium]|nr:S-layer homology domain-containing protein [Actinomycetota bacterium]